MSIDRVAKLRSMLDSDPADAFTRYALALEHAAVGDLAAALDLLEDLRRSQRDYVPVYHQLGVLYERQGDNAKAEAIYAEGIAVAHEMGDDHAAAEMQEALDLLS